MGSSRDAVISKDEWFYIVEDLESRDERR